MLNPRIQRLINEGVQGLPFRAITQNAGVSEPQAKALWQNNATNAQMLERLKNQNEGKYK